MVNLLKKRLTTLMLLWAISLSLSGCTSVQKAYVENPSVRDQIAPLVHRDVAPIALPDKFKSVVKTYTDETGKKWVLIDPRDLDRIKTAYTSAEGNAALVGNMNDYNRLVIERANMMRDLAILEEYRSAKLEIRIAEERDLAKAEREQHAMDLWLWRLAAVLALAVGI
ncbi:MAG: hypothetical protein ACRC6V_01455 [Bacteroidales bacterium]